VYPTWVFGYCPTSLGSYNSLLNSPYFYVQKSVGISNKYAPLIKELEKEGWNVRPTVHVITVGVRATVPIINVEVLKSLGIKEMNPAQQRVQASMTHVVAAHLNRIEPQYRRLCARQNECINVKKTGVG
jgi:hypothetical protein